MYEKVNEKRGGKKERKKKKIESLIVLSGPIVVYSIISTVRQHQANGSELPFLRIELAPCTMGCCTYHTKSPTS